ncbi:hypothetical protein [Acinetobacter sp. YH01006]|uniref:hypothetical protein n=1 Tax=Acinetobacter sp. YH01006 TaxID=2601022 RepID=UPI0015D325A4|nr:hypothetical protein [Acinetobacter sp. YH01006]
MELKEVITKALHANFAEWTEDQAEAVLKAINEAGFILIKSENIRNLKQRLENQYDTVNDAMHQEGYDDKSFGQLMALDFVEEVINEMIEAQEKANEL